MGHLEHHQLADSQVAAPIRCGVITISDTRTAETDTGGIAIRTALLQAGHDVVRYAIVRDEPEQIVALVQACEAEGCKVVITSGGTGIARRDSTFEALDSLLEKRLPGFGEIFRMLSYQDIGAAAMLSRATAGTYRKTLLFALPGSPAAVELALEKLILPELRHLIWETVR
jgi:molybdopterin adenylyltransferase